MAMIVAIHDIVIAPANMMAMLLNDPVADATALTLGARSRHRR